MPKPDETQTDTQIIDHVLYGTVDPAGKLDNQPAVTTLLHQVCGSDPGKFEEATRLIELFIKKAINRTKCEPAGITWISEQEALPQIGQTVLLATPRQTGEFWDIKTMTLLARHEDVVARPVKASSQWPTDFYWGDTRSNGGGSILITGNGWWASIASLPLPPGAKHDTHNGYTFVRQIGNVFIPQGDH